MPMLDVALGYAARGWLVFPIRAAGETYRNKDGVEVVSDGKVPATKNGFHDASKDEKKIRKWWGDFPDRNIGLVTNATSGIWVLDVDIDKETGEFGSDTLADLKKEYGSLPAGPVAVTPTGGEHYFFSWPTDGDVPRKIRFLPGLDALGSRGDKGGYLVAVPSVRPDGAYTWKVSPDVVSLPAAPAWLLDRIRNVEDRSRPADLERIKPVRSDKTTPYGRKALTDLCAEIAAATFGHQEVTLRDKAVRVGSLAYGGSIDVTEAFSSVMAAAMKMRSQPNRVPWSEQEIEGKVRRHFAYAMQDPTKAPASPRPAHHVQMPPNDDEDMPPVIEGDAPVDVEEYHDGETKIAPEPDAPKKRSGEPFRYLGYNRGEYFYLPDGKGQIVALKASEHTTLRLLELADLTYWCGAVGAEKVSKEQWMQLANGMMRNSERQGFFDPSWVRGRGAWQDGKQIIVHTGSEAMIDGNPVQLRAIKSRYVYEAGAPWDFGFGTPLNPRDAHKLVEICERLTWADKLSGALLAGWCVIAPVSGALKWRPHIWITGPSQSGKSTAQNEIVMRIAGPAGKRFDGKSSEASIRQMMGYDARPVFLDEAESEDQAAVSRMQGILDLARVASSGGDISKGGANHRAITFIARYCFCFSSINTAVRHHADESRISKLVLLPNRATDALDHFTALMTDINAWFTPEFAADLFARTIKYLPSLLKNCETFKAAASIELSSRRAADQLGPMLAGYYLCHKSDEITLADARAFIAKRDWSEYLSLDTNTDEMRLFEYIMSRPIRVSRSGSIDETTIGGAIEKARSEGDRRDPYSAALGARGIKVDYDMVAISDSAEVTRALFDKMPQWASDWKRPMRNLPGAVTSKGAERFAPGVITRATWVPYGLLDGSYVPSEVGEDG